MDLVGKYFVLTCMGSSRLIGIGLVNSVGITQDYVIHKWGCL